MERIKDQLIHIAADGKLCRQEQAEFAAIMREMVELEKQICELKYFALRCGIEVDDIMPGKKEVA